MLADAFLNFDFHHHHRAFFKIYAKVEITLYERSVCFNSAYFIWVLFFCSPNIYKLTDNSKSIWGESVNKGSWSCAELRTCPLHRMKQKRKWIDKWTSHYCRCCCCIIMKWLIEATFSHCSLIILIVSLSVHQFVIYHALIDNSKDLVIRHLFNESILTLVAIWVFDLNCVPEPDLLFKVKN